MQHVASKCVCAAGWMRISHDALLHPALVSSKTTENSQNYECVGVKTISPEGYS